MKVEIKSVSSGFYEIDDSFKDKDTSLQLGAAVILALKNNADLRYADLRDVDLEHANLRGANLEPIKKDFFDVLIRSIPEINFLEEAIVSGKIDGSTYEGSCAGTIAKSGRVNVDAIKDAKRPIERFFIGISPGDTPENNLFSLITYNLIKIDFP